MENEINDTMTNEEFEKMTDEEFIQGSSEFFPLTKVDKEKKVPDVQFYWITKRGRERMYLPDKYLEIIMRLHFNLCDEAGSYNEQLVILANCDSIIQRKILNHYLDKLGYDFQRIFKDLEITKKRIEAYKNNDLPYQKMINKIEPNNASNKDTPNKLIIKKYLEPFTEKAFNENDNTKIIESLQGYFDNKKDVPKKAFPVKYRNKKKLAYALGCIYKDIAKVKLTFDYVSFCKSLFDIFSDEIISENGFNKCRLYTYFHTNKQ